MFGYKDSSVCVCAFVGPVRSVTSMPSFLNSGVLPNNLAKKPVLAFTGIISPTYPPSEKNCKYDSPGKSASKFTLFL